MIDSSTAGFEWIREYPLTSNPYVLTYDVGQTWIPGQYPSYGSFIVERWDYTNGIPTLVEVKYYGVEYL